jgi:hypothetical protein
MSQDTTQRRAKVSWERLRAANDAATDAGFPGSAKFDGSGIHGRTHLGNIVGFTFVAACGLTALAYEQIPVEVPYLCRRCAVAIEKATRREQ